MWHTNKITLGHIEKEWFYFTGAAHCCIATRGVTRQTGANRRFSLAWLRSLLDISRVGSTALLVMIDKRSCNVRGVEVGSRVVTSEIRVMPEQGLIYMQGYDRVGCYTLP
jgi:hypothetical protein